MLRFEHLRQLPEHSDVTTTVNGDVLTSHCFAEGLLRQIPEAVVTVLRSACAAVATTTHLPADDVSITHYIISNYIFY